MRSRRAAGQVGVMTAASTDTPLLTVDALEVAYHRVAVALHGVSLKRHAADHRGACSATTAPARPRRCARSPASSASTMRASSPAASAFAGRRIENQPPHANTARGIVLVPERDKVFPNLTVAENLTVAASHRAECGRAAPA